MYARKFIIEIKCGDKEELDFASKRLKTYIYRLVTWLNDTWLNAEGLTMKCEIKED